MDASHRLVFDSERSGQRLSVRVRGDLDFASIPRLLEFLTAAVGEGVATCALDLAGLTFIDGDAVRKLVAFRRKLAGRGVELLVLRCSQCATRAFALLGVSSELGLARDRSERQA